MNDNNLKYNIGELSAASPDTKAADSLEQKKRDQKKTLLKISAAGILAFVVIIFGSIAWFAANKIAAGNGMGVKVQGDLFSVEPMPSPYLVGIYDDSGASSTYVRNRLLAGASKDLNTMTWTITNDTASVDPSTNNTVVSKGKNFGNGPAAGYEGGIGPGSSGELQFKVIPNGSVDAEFTFYLYAYSIGYDEQGDEDKSTIALIGENDTADRAIAKNLLNGHILLFENYNTQTGKYSGLITSNEYLNRIMTGTYSSQETVSVHWVWPETLAELVLDETNNDHSRHLRGKNALCSGTDRTDIIEYIKAHPSWFFYDTSTPNRTWSEITSATNERMVSIINTSYSLYSSYYNEADQCIGTNVAYILLNMSAEGSATLDE